MLNDAPPGLARAAIYGRCVFSADGAIVRAFERDVQLRAADVDVFLRRLAPLKLAVLRT